MNEPSRYLPIHSIKIKVNFGIFLSIFSNLIGLNYPFDFYIYASGMLQSHEYISYDAKVLFQVLELSPMHFD